MRGRQAQGTPAAHRTVIRRRLQSLTRSRTGGDNAMQTALVIILLLAILAGAVFVGHYGWVSAGDVATPAWGWLMMGLGILL